MKIISTISVKRQSERSKESDGYQLWHLLSIKSIHHAAQENNAMWGKAKCISINASQWYKPQVDITVLHSEKKTLSSFLQWQSVKTHCQLFLFFTRMKKILASALISKTDHKTVPVVLLWRHQLVSATVLFSHSAAAECFAGPSANLFSRASPHAQLHNPFSTNKTFA